jgi:ribose 5-phosphate isomerase B
MKIYLATDHAGFEHKENLKKHLVLRGFEVHDCGAEKLIPDDDYVPYMMHASELVSSQSGDPDCRAIIFGGSGQGEAITANRFPNVRAAVYYGGPLEIVKLSREHNNANILSIGARFVTIPDMISAVDLWLATDFSNEDRHKRRITEIDKITW